MNRTCQSVLSGASLLLGCLCFSQAQAPQDPFERLYFDSPLLIGKTKAWIVQEPQVISTGKVVQMLFGPGPDEAVVITRSRKTAAPKLVSASDSASEAASEIRISVANLSTGASRLRGKFQCRSVSAEWASKGRLLQLWPDEETCILDIESGSVFRLPDDRTMIPVISQIPHLALLRRPDWARPNTEERSAPAAVTMTLVDFSMSPPKADNIRLPRQAMNFICLAANGVLITHDGGINLRTGEVKRLTTGEIQEFIDSVGERRKTVEIESSVDKKGISLVVQEDLESREHKGLGSHRQAATSKEGSNKPMRPRMRISEEAWGGEVSDSEQWALFQAHGAGFAVQLTPVNLEAALRSLLEHARRNALSFAKQSGTAAAIYSSDYDDFLPISGGQARDALMPYLKNGRILDSVVWTNLTGQNSSKLANPSETVLGYVPGPGGRAVIYADTHVVWVPD